MTTPGSGPVRELDSTFNNVRFSNRCRIAYSGMQYSNATLIGLVSPQGFESVS